MLLHCERRELHDTWMFEVKANIHNPYIFPYLSMIQWVACIDLEMLGGGVDSPWICTCVVGIVCFLFAFESRVIVISKWWHVALGWLLSLSN